MTDILNSLGVGFLDVRSTSDKLSAVAARNLESYGLVASNDHRERTLSIYRKTERESVPYKQPPGTIFFIMYHGNGIATLFKVDINPSTVNYGGEHMARLTSGTILKLFQKANEIMDAENVDCQRFSICPSIFTPDELVSSPIRVVEFCVAPFFEIKMESLARFFESDEGIKLMPSKDGGIRFMINVEHLGEGILPPNLKNTLDFILNSREETTEEQAVAIENETKRLAGILFDWILKGSDSVELGPGDF